MSRNTTGQLTIAPSAPVPPQVPVTLSMGGCIWRMVLVTAIFSACCLILKLVQGLWAYAVVESIIILFLIFSSIQLLQELFRKRRGNTGQLPTQHQPPTPLSLQGCTVRIMLGLLFGLFAVGFVFWNTIVVSIAAVISALVAIILLLVHSPQPNINNLLSKVDQWLANSHVQWQEIGSRVDNRIRSSRIFRVSIRLVVLSVLQLVVLWQLFPFPTPIINACPDAENCVQVINGQLIGISSGNYHFWSGNGSDNAENKIYQANGKIPQQDPFVTIVVVAPLSGDIASIGDGHDLLQGAYLFQSEINGEVTGDDCAAHPRCLKLRILVANIGGDSAYAMNVAQQIVRIKDSNSKFIGVMGWPESTAQAIEGIRYLGENKVMVISPTASSDALTGISPYFFRVAPPDSQQGPIGAQYAEKEFPERTHATIFYTDDPMFPYSRTLASSFAEEFTKISRNTVSYELYNRHDDNSIDCALQQVMYELGIVHEKPSSCTLQQTQAMQASQSGRNTTLFYFSGYSDDLGTFLNELRDQSTFNVTDIPVFTGDAGYGHGFTGNSYQNIYFTAFASPDEWLAWKGYPCDDPALQQTFGGIRLCYYAKDFDPQKQHPGERGFSRADSGVMLSYDAIKVLWQGYHIAYDDICHNAGSGCKPVSDDIQQALLGFDGCNEFQGISGSIEFGLDGNPVNKPVVLIYVQPGSLTAYEDIPGGSLTVQGTAQECTGL